MRRKQKIVEYNKQGQKTQGKAAFNRLTQAKEDGTIGKKQERRLERMTDIRQNRQEQRQEQRQPQQAPAPQQAAQPAMPSMAQNPYNKLPNYNKPMTPGGSQPMPGISNEIPYGPTPNLPEGFVQGMQGGANMQNMQYQPYQPGQGSGNPMMQYQPNMPSFGPNVDAGFNQQMNPPAAMPQWMQSFNQGFGQGAGQQPQQNQAIIRPAVMPSNNNGWG